MSGLYTSAEYAAAKESHDFWKNKGCDELHIACLLGNEDGEVGFNTRPGDHDQADGIFQWHGPRRRLILTHTGIDVWKDSHLKQLEAAFREMSEPWSAYRHVWPGFLAETTTTGCVTVLVAKEEQSASPSTDVPKRVDHASFWLEYAKENWL